MSLALTHFAFGAAMTTLLLLFLPQVRYPRTLVLGGGGWAMVPDLHWVSPVASETLREIHRTSPLMDLFWLHRTLDRLDPTDSPAVAAGFLAALVVLTLVAERRDYRAPAVVERAYRTYLNTDATDSK
jgi:hypothetical protein